jgi:hypothetical protein
LSNRTRLSKTPAATSLLLSSSSVPPLPQRLTTKRETRRIIGLSVE